MKYKTSTVYHAFRDINIYLSFKNNCLEAIFYKSSKMKSDTVISARVYKNYVKILPTSFST